MRNGRDYDPAWGKRMKGEGPIAEMIAKRFALARRRFGLDKPQPALDATRFRRPRPVTAQADLFDRS
jgi:hypothetical protein